MVERMPSYTVTSWWSRTGSECRGPIKVLVILKTETSGLRGRRRGEIMTAQRQPPDAPSGGGEEGVGHRRRYRREGDLAHPARIFVALHQKHLDRWYLVQAKKRIFVVIPLNDGAVLDRDLPLQGGAQAVDGGAERLRLRARGI